ncbi:MAG: phosphatidylserine decarboxylase family protein [Deltaproteobacteria bacterium]|nr:phosphatidylserine decarboxylase family protein [Deltaproteobacteria bacterium]
MADHREIIVGEGLPFVVGSLILCLAAFFLFGVWLAFPLLIVTLFVTWFFRNPERSVPSDEKSVLSPADGKVIRIEDIRASDLLGTPAKKVSIFMNVFNVHVNRIPYSGVVRAIEYKKGKFLSANLDKASTLNERNAVVIRMEDGREIMTIQIAGLIARRIVCWLENGMHVKKGDRFGLIRFGSRLEVFLPVDVSISVNVGDTVKAGVTPLGTLT